MKGSMKITYTVLCDNDLEITLTMAQMLENEKVLKAIKSAFAPQTRNIELTALCDEALKITTQKEEYSFEIPKDDFADALTLAEEDAKKHKRTKKGCERVQLVDIETI